MMGRCAQGVGLLLIVGLAVGLQGLERARFIGLPREPLRTVPVTLHEASAGVEGGSTFGLFTALREEAAGAVLTADPAATDAISPLFATQIGLIARMETAAAGPPGEPTIAASAATADRERAGPGWRLLLAPGRPTQLHATVDGSGDLVIADVRLGAREPVPTTAPATASATAPLPTAAPQTRASSLPWTIASDALLLILLLAAGGLALPHRVVSRTLRVPVAFLTGVSLQATLGLLLLPAPWSLIMLPVVAIAVAGLLARAGSPSSWRREDVPGLAIAVAAATAIATLVRSGGLTIISNDSFNYWAGARALAAGELSLADLELKRGLGLQSLHALASGLGSEALLALGPALLLAGVALLALIPWEAGAGGTGIARLVAAGVAVLAASSAWMWFNALYLNAHVLVAVLLLLIAALALLTRDADDLSAAMLPIGLAMAAVVLLRAEAVLVLGLLLLGTLADHRGLHAWRWAWWSSGLALVAWNALLIAGQAARGDGVPTVLVGGVLAGGLLLLAPRLLSQRSPRWTAGVPVAVGAVLWSFTMAIALTSLGEDVVFFELVRRNLGELEGQWYLTAPLVAVLAGFGLATTARHDRVGPARWLVIGFVPATLLAKLADGIQGLADRDELVRVLLSGGGRPGWGDSVNRMWTHVVMVVLLLVIAAVMDVRSKGGGQRGARRRPPVSLIAPVAIALVVTAWWQADHLGPLGPVELTTLVAQPPSVTGADPDGASVAVELVGGETREQVIMLPRTAIVPEDAVWTRICADVALTDFSRPNAGSFLIALDAGQEQVDRLHQGRSQSGGATKSTCVLLDPQRPLPDHMTVMVVGVEGREGFAAGLLLNPDGSFVTSAALEVDAPSVDPRHPVVRSVSWMIRSAIQWGPGVLAVIATLLVFVSAGGARTPRRVGA